MNKEEHIHNQVDRYVYEDTKRHALETYCKECGNVTKRHVEEHVFENRRCIKCSCEEKVGIIANVVEVGDYVEYIPDKTNYRICDVPGTLEDQVYNPSKTTSWRVFSNDGNNVQLISSKSIGDLTVWITYGYTHIVKLLNELCSAYVNPNYAVSGRSIGSTEEWTETIVEEGKSLGVIDTDVYPLDYGVNQFPYVDEFYMDDVNTINENGLNITKKIWLASRTVETHDTASAFAIRYLDGNKIEIIRMIGTFINGVHGGGSSQSSYGVCPIITLKSEVNVYAGDGRSANPYRITVDNF